MKKIEKKKLIGLLSATACACLATACVVCAPTQDYKVNAETVSEISLDFSDATHGAEFSGVAGVWYGWKTENGKLIPDNTFVETSQLAYMTKTIALNETKYIAFDFYTAEENLDIMLYPSACIPNDMWTKTALGLHACVSAGANVLQLNTYLDVPSETWLADAVDNYLFGNAHRIEILSNGENLTFYLDGTKIYGDKTVAIPADEVNLAVRGNKDAYIDNLYIGSEKPEMPALTETVLEFDKASDGIYFAPSEGSTGWSVADGIYKPNASWAAIYSTETLDLTKNWSVKFDMYLPDDATNQQFNVGFHVDPSTASNAGTGITYSIGNSNNYTSIWISSNFGRGAWLSECVVDYYTASVHSVEIQIVKKAMTLFVDGTELYFPPYQAVDTGDTVYMLLQSTDATAYIDNLEIKEKIAKYVVTVKDIDGNELAKERAEGAYVLPERAETDKGAFIGYNVNGELYSAGKEINVTADTEIVAVFAKLSMDAEASIRLKDPSGLRFTTRVENDAYIYLQGVSTVALGTLITKADYFTGDDYSGLTTDFAETKLDIVSKVGKVDGENYVFNGVIVGVKSSHYDWDFVSRGYMTVTYADGTSATFYTNTTVRSIVFVANEAYLDRSTIQDETVYKYLTADGDYSRYTEDELELLASFKAQA